MNQYQANVTQEALRQLDEQAQKAQNQLAGQAVRAGTFGGNLALGRAAFCSTRLFARFALPPCSARRPGFGEFPAYELVCNSAF